MLTIRNANLAGFLACTGMMAFALYAEHVLGLVPCPLCIFQRVATIALGVIFLAAAIGGAGALKQRLNALLILMAAGAGIGLAGRHLWLQNLPPDQVPACGPDLDFMLESLPLAEVLQKVLTGSGECAEVSWSFLGLSTPGWTLICFVVLGVFGIWSNLRLGN